MERGAPSGVCDRFAPQLWRASSCKNCFQPKSLHQNIPDQEQNGNQPEKPRSSPRRATFAGRRSEEAGLAAKKNTGSLEHGDIPRALGGVMTGVTAPVQGAAHSDSAKAIGVSTGQEEACAAAAFLLNGEAGDLQHASNKTTEEECATGEAAALSASVEDTPEGEEEFGNKMDILACTATNYTNGEEQGEEGEGGEEEAKGEGQDEEDDNVGENAAAVGPGRNSLLSAIQQGVPLRKVPSNVKQRADKNKPRDVQSELQQKLMKKVRSVVEVSKARIDAHQSEIDRLAADLTTIGDGPPVRLALLRQLCEETTKLRNRIQVADDILRNRVSWPLSMQKSVEAAVAVVQTLEKRVARLQSLAEAVMVPGREHPEASRLSVEPSVTAISDVLQSCSFVQNVDHIYYIVAKEISVDARDIDGVLDNARSAAVLILTCLFERGFQTAEGMLEAGLSRFEQVFRVNSAYRLLNTACTYNDRLAVALQLARHPRYSEAQLACSELKDKHEECIAVAERTGEWDKAEEVSLRPTDNLRSVPKSRRNTMQASECIVEAVRSGNTELISVLLSANNRPSNMKVVMPPLVQAAITADLLVLDCVLDSLVNWDVAKNHEFDWLHEAMVKRQMDTLKHLITTRGFDINCRGASSQTLMHIAARREDLKMIAALMKNGADPLLLNPAHHTPLEMLAFKVFPSKPVVKASNQTATSEDHLDLSLYINSPNLSDVVLLCDDEDGGGKARCFAHRVILCARSSVFRTMLDSDHWAEASQREVYLADIQHNVLLLLLQFAYTGTCFFPRDDLDLGVKLMAAADRFLLPCMVRQVQDVLCDRISAEVVVPLYFAAFHYSAPDLLRETTHFILRYYAQVEDPDHAVLLHILENCSPVNRK